MTAAVEILAEAARIVSGDRHDQYGPAERSFAGVAAMWQAYLDARPEGRAAAINARDVCWLMVLLKAARDAHSPKQDNAIDAAGYAALAGEVTA